MPASFSFGSGGPRFRITVPLGGGGGHKAPKTTTQGYGCCSSILIAVPALVGLSWLFSLADRPAPPRPAEPPKARIKIASTPPPTPSAAPEPPRTVADPPRRDPAIEPDPPAPPTLYGLTIEQRQAVYAKRLSLDAAIDREVERRFPSSAMPGKEPGAGAWRQMRKSAYQRIYLAGLAAIRAEYKLDPPTLAKIVDEGNREGWGADDEDFVAKLGTVDSRGLSEEYKQSLRQAAETNRAEYRRKYSVSARTRAMDEAMDQMIGNMFIQDAKSQQGPRGGFGRGGPGGGGRCGAPTQSGGSCRNPVGAGQVHCYLHGG